MVNRKKLKEELDARLEEIKTWDPASDERKQLFQEYLEMYRTYLESRGQWVDVGKNVLDAAKTAGTWAVYIIMAKNFMDFDRSGEIPDSMHRSLLTKISPKG